MNGSRPDPTAHELRAEALEAAALLVGEHFPTLEGRARSNAVTLVAIGYVQGRLEARTLLAGVRGRAPAEGG